MNRTRTSTLIAPVLLALSVVVVLPPAPSVAAIPGCRLAGTGMVDHVWQNGDGTWSDPDHWSTGEVPGTGGPNDYACIGDGVAVTIDAAARVDLTAFELGRDSTLALTPGSSLLVWGDQAKQPSVTRRDSLVDVRGATLGGSGLIGVAGTVRLESSDVASASLSTESALGYDGPGGKLRVGDVGTLVVAGAGNVGLRHVYTVQVHGRAQLLDGAAVVADPRTTFEVTDEHKGKGPGTFVIGNDGGYLAPPDADLTQLSRFVNEGLVVKRAGSGTSVVTAAYSGKGQVRVESGSLVLPDAADDPVTVESGARVGSGTCVEIRVCSTDTTVDEPQFATLRVPEAAGASAQVVVTSLPALDGTRVVGLPIRAHVLNNGPPLAEPVVISLRYDQTLLRDEGRPLNPDRLVVARAQGPGMSYENVPECDGRLVPATTTACVDRRGKRAPVTSRREDGDVVLVVRAVVTSRWMVR
jgi:hypothetical protein